MGVLDNYKPQEVFRFFEEICAIPHGSGNGDGIVGYLENFARTRGLESEHDAANNVVIRKKASAGYENADTIILQGHHDMACEKDAGVIFDFQKDGIIPVVDGDTIRAKGTTLGGDNGIAVAMILAILDDDTLPHPAIEALITADEEIGMVGAFAFDCNRLTGHKLINLDSDYEGVLMCSCAGGITARSTLPVIRESAAGRMVSIEIKGLTSGHSGVEIDKGRANANVLMARMLSGLAQKADYRIVALAGGTRETAIAAVANAKLVAEEKNVEALRTAAQALADALRKEYATTEPGLAIEVSMGEKETASALTQESTRLVYSVLLALPDSVQAMSADMPGLVQTSTNMGVVELREAQLYISNSIRSAMTTQKHWIFDKVAAIVRMAGGSTEANGDYPGWAYNPHSVLKDTILACYEKLTGKQATVEAVHAGIECGLFADSIPNLDCVSIGPTMGNVHTPNEYLSISSTERTYTLLKMVLAQSK